VEAAHTDFPKVTGVVLVKVGTADPLDLTVARERKGVNKPVMVLSTSETTSSRMLAVFPNTTMAGRYVPAVLTSFRKSGWHLSSVKPKLFCSACHLES
jgi:hypothetical protein